MIDSIVFFLVAISSLAVSLIVFRQNPKNKANQYFARMSLFAIIWLSANFLENEPLSLYYRKLALELDFSSAVFMVVSFYLFCLTFPKNNTISTKKEVATYFPALFIFILSFTSTIIKNINLDNSTIIFDRGNGFFLYLIVVLLYISFGFKNLYQRYKISTGVEKTQILYVFLGIFIFAIIATPINLILPQFIFVPLGIARIGIYSFFAFSILTTFAIIRYHLFDIKIILTELLVGAIGIILIVLPFFMPSLIIISRLLRITTKQ